MKMRLIWIEDATAKPIFCGIRSKIFKFSDLVYHVSWYDIKALRTYKVRKRIMNKDQLFDWLVCEWNQRIILQKAVAIIANATLQSNVARSFS